MKRILVTNLALMLASALTLNKNSVTVEAALIRDPELSYSGGGKAYASLSFGGSQDGKRFYHTMTVLGDRSVKLAELKSGAVLRVGARLEYSTYQNADGQSEARNKLTLGSAREVQCEPQFTAVLSELTGDTNFVLDGASSSITLEGIVVGNRGLNFTNGHKPEAYTVLTVVYPNPGYYDGGSAPELGSVEVLVMGYEAQRVADLGVGWATELEGRAYLPRKTEGKSNGLAIYADRVLAFSAESLAAGVELEVEEDGLPESLEHFEGELEDYLH